MLGVWLIPATTMKMRREHLVPLSTQALDVLRKMKERSRGSVYVFAADHRLDRYISENAVLALIARMGYKGLLTGHGFRSIGSTWGNENGYNSDHIEMQLAHDSDDDIRGAYNNAKYLDRRRDMMQNYADWLDMRIQIVHPT